MDKIDQVLTLVGKEKVFDLFVNKVIFCDDSCWIWSGILVTKYPQILISKIKLKPHRLSYALYNGKLIDGLVIDHICMNKRCVNPKHLRQVTRRINSIENNNGPTAINSRKTHCHRGHELSADNLLNIKCRNERVCRECNKINASIYRSKNKEKIRIKNAERWKRMRSLREKQP